MLIWPAFGRRLDGSVAITGEAISRCIGQEKLENGLEETRIQMQWNMYQSELCVLEGDHVSNVSSGRSFCVGGEI